MKRYKKVTKTCWTCKGKPQQHHTKYGAQCWTCNGEGIYTAKLQIMRCCGGPHSGKSMTEEEAGNDYIRYNPSNNKSGKYGWPCVLIHLDMLEADE